MQLKQQRPNANQVNHGFSVVELLVVVIIAVIVVIMIVLAKPRP